LADNIAMSEARNLLPLLRQSADAEAAAAIEALVQDGLDRELCRVNVLEFAANKGLDEERAIAAFLHAARLGYSNCRGTCCARAAAVCSTAARH
jgi:hypothetical protein